MLEEKGIKSYLEMSGLAESKVFDMSLLGDLYKTVTGVSL